MSLESILKEKKARAKETGKAEDDARRSSGLVFLASIPFKTVFFVSMFVFALVTFPIQLILWPICGKSFWQTLPYKWLKDYHDAAEKYGTHGKWGDWRDDFFW